jgi:Fe2+ transport system protein FeoA
MQRFLKINLAELKCGKKAKIVLINSEKKIRHRMMELGLNFGETVEMLGSAPFGDPLKISAKGCDIIIRKQDAEKIMISI